MSVWKIGNVRITRVVEIDATRTGTELLPSATPEALAKEAEWLAPAFIDDAGNLKLSVHTFIVESQGKRILVDTCIGNDKERASFPEWDHLQLPFLQSLESAGCARESVDRVICTHLHVDHVGWNTMLERGKWVPTFPNAKYLIGGTEWDFFSRQEDEFFKAPVDDSVRPVISDGLAKLVDETERITEEVWLESTPGHTPGHFSVRISSNGENAVITGDMMHHPLQCRFPEWDDVYDVDGPLAKRTRRAFCERYADTGTLILGTHFATPSAGRIVRHGDSFRFLSAEPGSAGSGAA
jgi:glyoxylase-like metal-dependent hydrolase (beta-lactamase superfamily II)